MARISKEMKTVLLDGEKDISKTRFLQVRKEIRSQLETGKYPIRVDITWQYDGDNAEMPTEETSNQIESFEEALIPALERNNLALLAYLLTGEGERLWSFYTRNLEAFQSTLNESLAELPLFPLSFYAEEDPEAEAFAEVEPFLALGAHE